MRSLSSDTYEKACKALRNLRWLRLITDKEAGKISSRIQKKFPGQFKKSKP